MQESLVKSSETSSLSRAWPLVILLLSVFFMAFSTIFIKISELELSANSTHFNRLWIATLIFGSWSAIRQLSSTSDENSPIIEEEIAEKYTRQNIIYILILALSHTGARFFWTWCLTQTSAANGNVLCNLASIFTVLGGWLFVGKKFDSRFLTGVAVSFLGAAVLGFYDWSISPASFIGDLAALASAVCFSISFLSTEKIRSTFSVSTILTWRCFLGLLMLAPLTFFFEAQILPVSTTGWLAVIGLATISEVLGHGLVIYSLKHFSSAFVSLFVLLEPVAVACLAWLFFDEGLSVVNLLAFSMVFLGIYIAKTGEGAAAETA